MKILRVTRLLLVTIEPFSFLFFHIFKCLIKIKRKKMCPSANFSHFLLIILALLKGFPYLKGIESANVVAENYSIRVASQSSARVLEDEKETRISEALNPVLVLDNTVNVRELLKEDPFSQWTYRSRWSELNDLELTSDSMSKAIQAGKLLV